MEGTSTSSEMLIFRADINDIHNHPTLTLMVETLTRNHVIQLSIRDRESLENLMTVHVPAAAAQAVGQALMLAASLKGG